MRSHSSSQVDVWVPEEWIEPATAVGDRVRAGEMVLGTRAALTRRRYSS